MKLHLLFLLTSHPFTFQRKKKFKSSTCYLLTDDWPSRRVGHGKQPTLRRDVFNGQVNLNHKCTFPLYHLIVFNLIKVDLPEPLPSFDYELISNENVISIYTRRLRISESSSPKNNFDKCKLTFGASVCLKPLKVFSEGDIRSPCRCQWGLSLEINDQQSDWIIIAFLLTLGL